MKIGIICYPTVGGSGVLATELGNALALRGHEVHFITYEMPFKMRADLENVYFHEVEINRYDLFKYPDYALPLAVKMAQVAKQYNLDIFHAHYAIPHATSAYLAKQLLGTPKPRVVTTLHGTDITIVGRDPSYKDIVKYSIENSCGVTAVSDYLRAQTIESFKVKHPIETIYNFFVPNLNLIGKKNMRNQFVKNGEKLLIHSSNFRTIKRSEDVLKIFSFVKKDVPSRLLLVGSGPDLDHLRTLVHEQNLQHDVFFLGSTLYVDPFIASGDLFLLPSEQESFGLAALESMAYGVPVVASNAGGLPELIVHGESGLLAPVGDVDKMAEEAVKLLTDKQLYEHISAASTARAKNEFSAEKIVPQYEAFYQNMMN